MADIDIFNIQPHQVSRDLRGYSGCKTSAN